MKIDEPKTHGEATQLCGNYGLTVSAFDVRESAFKVAAALLKAKAEGYEESTKRAIDMAVFNIPYICVFENIPARLVGIVIPEEKKEATRKLKE